MSMRGAKRPMLETTEQVAAKKMMISQPVPDGADDQNSTECHHVQPVPDMADDHNSPECPHVQPVPDMADDHNSPECLFPSQPVRDCYSSDDSSKKKTLKKKKAKQPAILSARSDSSEFTGPQVLFFFDLDYEPQPEPGDFFKLPVTSILQEMFQFIYGDKEDKQFRKDGKTMEEVYSYHLENPWLSWMRDHDVMDLKVISAAQWKCKLSEYESELAAVMNELGVCAAKDINNVLNIIRLLYSQYSRHGCTKSGCMKELFLHIHSLLQLTAHSQNRVTLRFYGTAEYVLKYCVPAGLVSAGCDLVSCDSGVHVQPDAVLATVNSDRTTDTGRVLVQVFGLKDDCLPPEKKLQVTNVEGKRQKKQDIVKKPERRKDAILTKDYEAAAYDYLRASVPVGCEDHQTLTALTAHHVLQLIALAAEQDKARRAEQFNKTQAERCMSTVTTHSPFAPVPLGIFMKNERVIFSKLILSPSKMDSYFGSKLFSVENGGWSNDVGKVSYSNLCLDLSQADHRMAFMVCLLELLHPQT